MDFVAKETEVIGQEKLLVELALELICQGGGEISVTGGFAEGERQRSVWNVWTVDWSYLEAEDGRWILKFPLVVFFVILGNADTYLNSVLSD